ncbi:hypothetical protein LP418_21195 [Nocardioides sp. B-3]|nr:hypothetical protein [Nocardioides sp. B-3]UUZ58628.1 hypothetical protein LP418_21195 [Nocardioides sp. B-3]
MDVDEARHRVRSRQSTSRHPDHRVPSPVVGHASMAAPGQPAASPSAARTTGGAGRAPEHGAQPVCHRVHQRCPRIRETAAQHHHLAAEDSDARRKDLSQRVRGLRPHVLGDGVTGVHPVSHVGGPGHLAAAASRVGAGDRPGGGDRLEATATAALARHIVSGNPDVPDLTGPAACSDQDPVHHCGCRYPGADGHEEGVPDAGGRARATLPEPTGPDVVGDPDLAVRACRQLGGDRHVVPPEVGRTPHRSEVLVEDAGNGHADPDDLVGTGGFDDRSEVTRDVIQCHGRRDAVRGRRPELVVDHAVATDRGTLDQGAADVECHDPLPHRGVTPRPDGGRRTGSGCVGDRGPARAGPRARRPASGTAPARPSAPGVDSTHMAEVRATSPASPSGAGPSDQTGLRSSLMLMGPWRYSIAG